MIRCEKPKDQSLWVIFEVSPMGRVKSVFLHAKTREDEMTLTRTLDRLFKPSTFSWIRRLFQGGQNQE